jgi:redox-sensing transcriptional repressor
MMNKDIPIFSLKRLPDYLNYLRALPANEKNKYISSGAIAQALGLGEVLVRKDLAYTPCVGKPKVGYVREELIAAIEEFLSCNNPKNAVIVGAGGLGKALLSYDGFVHYGIEVVAAFDNDQTKVGVAPCGKSIYYMTDLSKVCAEHNVAMAIITVPAKYAQQVADQLVDAGVKAILNFASVQLRLDESIKVINMDVAANLAVLAAMMV